MTLQKIAGIVFLVLLIVLTFVFARACHNPTPQTPVEETEPASAQVHAPGAVSYSAVSYP